MDDAFVAIQKIIPNKELNALKNIIIFQDEDGAYNVYGKYLITKNIDGIYVVSVIGTYTEKNFYKLKNALDWCSFDSRVMIKKAKRLHQLDQMIFSMDTEIQLHTRLIKKSKTEENALIYLSKLSQNKAKKRSYLSELSHSIDEYQRWQTQLFNTKPSY